MWLFKLISQSLRAWCVFGVIYCSFQKPRGFSEHVKVTFEANSVHVWLKQSVFHWVFKRPCPHKTAFQGVGGDTSPNVSKFKWSNKWGVCFHISGNVWVSKKTLRGVQTSQSFSRNKLALFFSLLIWFFFLTFN